MLLSWKMKFMLTSFAAEIQILMLFILFLFLQMTSKNRCKLVKTTNGSFIRHRRKKLEVHFNWAVI